MCLQSHCFTWPFNRFGFVPFANSIVFDYLQSKQLLNTVSVFAPESSIGNAALAQPDLLQALHLPGTTLSSGVASVLDACVAKLSKQVLPAFAEASSQTESGSASVREHLGQALRCLSFCLSCVFDSRPYVS
jgi:hypothetical protein